MTRLRRGDRADATGTLAAAGVDTPRVDAEQLAALTAAESTAAGSHSTSPTSRSSAAIAS